MNISRFSVRPIAVVLIVSVSMVVVAFASAIYRDIALENQRIALAEVLQREADRLLVELDEVTIESAIHLNSDEQFRRALELQNPNALAHFLDNQFKQYLISAGILRLVQIYIYTPEFELFTQSSKGPLASGSALALCDNLVRQAGQRQGAERYQIYSGLCAHLNRPFYSAIVPVGGLKLKGYVQVVVDPLHNFSTIGERLGLPVKLVFNNGIAGYRSADWMPASHQGEVFESAYWLTDKNRLNVLGVFVQKSMAPLIEQTHSARNQLLLIAGAVTTLAVFMMLIFLDKMTIKPLRHFVNQAKRASTEHRPLQAPIDIQANGEINELVEVFNRMHSELATLHDRHEQIAFFDSLTKLPNRALFKDRLEQMILLSERRGDKLAVLLLDLDDFKEINETLGYQAGDEMLKKIGAHLNKTLRASSTLARMGYEGQAPYPRHSGGQDNTSTVARLNGDEFAILLPHVNDAADAASVAMRIAESLVQLEEAGGDVSVPLSATMGIAIYPDHGKDAKTLLGRADIALYAARNEQCDFVVYDVSHEQHSAQQLELKVELRHAIDNDDLTLYFQPKLDCRQQRISSVEALVRWHHPKYGDIDPAQFIKLSEHKGLIGPLTEWVIRHAIGQHKRWLDQGITVEVAINISSRVLYDLSLPNKIEQILSDNGLSPSAICIEISEEATMIDPRKVAEALSLLSSMGVRLAIDDFGTGFSSLGFLKNLPVDEIKIDRSFVTDMASSKDDASIVSATIDLAHNLGLEVVAEGVESGEVLAAVEALGCDFAQGYYLCKPLPAEQLAQWLASSEWQSS